MMKKGQLLRRYIILILIVSFLLLWINQSYYFRTKEKTLSEVDQDISWNNEDTVEISKEKFSLTHYDGSFEKRQTSTTKDNATVHKMRSRNKVARKYDGTMASKYSNDVGKVSENSTENGSSRILHVENDVLESKDLLKPWKSFNRNSKTLAAGMSTAVVLGINSQKQKLIKDEQDYGYKENVIFVAKMGNKNFVEVSEKAITKAMMSESIHRSSSRGQNSSRTEVIKSKPKQLPVSTSHRHSVILSELDSFAKLPTMPDYDLPLLKKTDLVTTERPVFMWPPVSHNSSEPPAHQDVQDVVSNNNDGEDDIMTSAVVLGEINPKKMYSVFSTTTDNREAIGFIFLLPLTTLAWKRIGFDSIIVIVGSLDSWNSNGMFHLVLSCVRELDAVVIFLEPRPEKSVLISQVSRIFVANILRARAAFANRQNQDVIDDIYIITTDADIWPLYGEVYRLPRNKRILSLNSECCGAFSHRGSSYKMLPMANIGMKIKTWRLLTQRFGQSPQSVDDILTCVVREFGPVALRPVHKGDNVGWFIDQMMISLLIATWNRNNNNSTDSVKFVPRDVGIDRIDRNWWNPGGGVTVEDKVDSHVLLNAHLPGVWVQIIPLIRAMYGDETDRYLWCIRYYDNFQKVFLSEYQNLNR